MLPRNTGQTARSTRSTNEREHTATRRTNMSRSDKTPPASDQLSVRREKGKVWSHIRKKWLVETPEETVRQEYLCTLVNEYGFSLDQMDEELEVTGRGSGHARADFVIWRTEK